jgi:hypothetical protein
MARASPAVYDGRCLDRGSYDSGLLEACLSSFLLFFSRRVAFRLERHPLLAVQQAKANIHVALLYSIRL